MRFESRRALSAKSDKNQQKCFPRPRQPVKIDSGPLEAEWAYAQHFLSDRSGTERFQEIADFARKTPKGGQTTCRSHFRLLVCVLSLDALFRRKVIRTNRSASREPGSPLNSTPGLWKQNGPMRSTFYRIEVVLDGFSKSLIC
jgi:hypothetical protein